ncbi:hypothetical protein GOP47_0008667 [Adiantum capillus-veneris]|uniref:Uncharacterized protein n=1 Tax=Adiantum capillus-veneris TaxID=13818 RepID=A0A9D4V097_ADICA|nr:hypothetical protein GOP47_0008667 [Adiantum capillus-veneris]
MVEDTMAPKEEAVERGDGQEEGSQQSTYNDNSNMWSLLFATHCLRRVNVKSRQHAATAKGAAASTKYAKGLEFKSSF